MRIMAIMMVLVLAPFASAVPIDGGDDKLHPGQGKEFVMPGDRVITGIEMQEDAFLKAKKAFNGEGGEEFLKAKKAFMEERNVFLKAKKAFDPKESAWPKQWWGSDFVMPGDN